MVRPTSSPKPSPKVEKSFNRSALNGWEIDDEMFISDYNDNELTYGSLDPDLAYTPDLMPEVIRLGIQEDLEKGLIDNEKAAKLQKEHLKSYRSLLARNGKIKK